MKPLVVIDIPVNVPPHVCLHVSARPGKRAYVSHGPQLDRRHAFREEVQLRIPRRSKTEIAIAVFIKLQFWRQCKRSADGDNLQKEALDALVQAHVLLDDSVVQSCHWEIVAQGPNVEPRLRAEIYAKESA